MGKRLSNAEEAQIKRELWFNFGNPLDHDWLDHDLRISNGWSDVGNEAQVKREIIKTKVADLQKPRP